MSWIDEERYIDTEISHLEINELLLTLERVMDNYQRYLCLEMPELSPTQKEAKALIREYRSIHKKLHFSKSKSMDIERLEEIDKQLRHVGERWGDFLVTQVKLGRVHFMRTGFPFLGTKRIRILKPSKIFRVELDKKTGTYSLATKRPTAPATFFHWEITENGGKTWTELAKTRKPYFTTHKLDLRKNYDFRLCLSNPKGKSEYTYHMPNLSV